MAISYHYILRPRSQQIPITPGAATVEHLCYMSSLARSKQNTAPSLLKAFLRGSLWNDRAVIKTLYAIFPHVRLQATKSLSDNRGNYQGDRISSGMVILRKFT